MTPYDLNLLLSVLLMLVAIVGLFFAIMWRTAVDELEIRKAINRENLTGWQETLNEKNLLHEANNQLLAALLEDHNETP